MPLSRSSQQRLVHVIEPILNPTLKKSHIVLMIDMVATGQGKNSSRSENLTSLSGKI